MREKEDAHPDLAVLEPWFNEMHLSLFDTLADAQAVTNDAGENEGMVVNTHSRVRSLREAFFAITHSEDFDNHLLAPLITRTLHIEKDRDVTQLHLAQTWAAATCTLTYFAMLNAIPASLLEEETVSGELRNKSKLHMAQWRKLLDDVR